MSQQISNERKEQLCIAGVTAVDMYSLDDASPDALVNGADDAETLADALQLLEGLILYSQLLETFLLIKLNIDPGETRKASIASAKLWRDAPTHPRETADAGRTD